ncbi:MAG: hypothetical protein KY459_14070 [Acidobacteria bacterium]|nr:hypothetical protein [Acidobacteriota bacterium]
MKRIPFAAPWITEIEVEAVSEAARSKDGTKEPVGSAGTSRKLSANRIVARMSDPATGNRPYLP